jgi:hypothetical protein
MRVAGYKLNGYNATYEHTEFDIKHGYNSEKNRVLEVTDIDSGVTFIFETEERYKCPKQPTRTSVWRS